MTSRPSNMPLNCEIVGQYRVQIYFVVSFQMSRLFVASILDPPGELEQKLETAHRSSKAMYLEPVGGDNDHLTSNEQVQLYI